MAQAGFILGIVGVALGVLYWILVAAGTFDVNTYSDMNWRSDSLGSEMNELPKTLLITLTGKDLPGVTSSVFATLAAAGVEVVDIEQIVLRRRLVLGVLVTAPRDWKRLRDAVELTASTLEMQVEIDRGVGDNKSRKDGRSHVTVIRSAA